MNIKIAIATNINFCEKTIPVIKQSLLESGIQKSDIFIFNGGFNQREIKVDDEITTIYMDHNSFEYSPLIEIAEHQMISNYWFLIHDTCKVGPKFKELLYFPLSSNPVKVALKTSPAMSIGVYKYVFIQKYKSKLLEIKNKNFTPEGLQKWKQWGIGAEDYLLWKTEPENTILFNSGNGFQTISKENWYGTSVTRVVEYYPQLDLYKNKSNWHPKNWMELNL